MRASSGQRYVVGCHNRLDKEKLNIGTQLVIDMTTLTVMCALQSRFFFLHELLQLKMRFQSQFDAQSIYVS